jgi:capsule polysaccharide export protein KpsE/RkpR
MNVWIDDAVLIAVGGLVVKEGASVIMKLRAKRNGNGKDKAAQISSLLSDIKGQGSLTLQKVGGIEKEQGSIKTDLAVVKTEMANFNKACSTFDERIKQVDERIYDHIRQGG